MPEISEFERDVERAIEELDKTLEELPKAEVPFNAVRLTDEEQLARYREMRDDPQAWRQLLAEKPFSSVLEYAQKMEKQHLKDLEEK